MLYSVKSEFIDVFNAGQTVQQITTMIEEVVAPSLEMLEKAIQAKKVTGGIVAGTREGFFIIEASSHEEVAEFLRSLPFWVGMKWTVVPLQSPRSAIEQDKVFIQRARAMSK
jgi:hypothetical protein